MVIGSVLIVNTAGLCMDFTENSSKRFGVIVCVVTMFILDIIIYRKKYENIIEFGCNYEKSEVSSPLSILWILEIITF